jgi:Cu-processing system permease protein
LAVALWLVAVVLYDLALLALIVSDGGGAFTTQALPVALLANPADAFRIFNLSAAAAVAAAGGIGGAAGSVPLWQSAASLVLWPLASIALATTAFTKVTP